MNTAKKELRDSFMDAVEKTAEEIYNWRNDEGAEFSQELQDSPMFQKHNSLMLKDDKYRAVFNNYAEFTASRRVEAFRNIAERGGWADGLVLATLCFPVVVEMSYHRARLLSHYKRNFE